MSATPEGALTVHASCVSFDGRGVLIRGRSGSGKSAMALQLLGLGAALVADDRTCLWREGGALFAGVPERIRGLVEARGVGLLNMPCEAPARVELLVDLDTHETERLPPRREARLLDVVLPLVGNPGGPHFPAAIRTYVMHGRYA